VAEQSRSAGRKATRGGTAGSARPAERRGAASSGRIVKLLIGQSHGFIRLADGREIYFHRSDLEEGTSFNDFAIGDPVNFELLEDEVSGARALRVKRRRQR
jgi:cold shock CspA family protein